MKILKPVTIISSPITERYVRPNMLAMLDTVKNQIQAGGVWFDVDNRWVIKEMKTKEQIQEELLRRVKQSISAWTEKDCDEYIAATDSFTIKRHCTLSNYPLPLSAENKMNLILGIEEHNINTTDLGTLSETYDQYPSLEWIKGIE